MGEQDRIAVVGAGVIGCAIAYALARAGLRVVLLDPHEPGVGGASYGNVGHIAAELVEPLPSPGLLFGFWRMLFAFGGPLDIPWRRLPHVALWARRFAAAAFRRRENTGHLAPLVRPASSAWAELLGEIGAPELLRRNGHCQVWFGPAGVRAAQREAQHMARLGIPTRPLEAPLLRTLAAAAGQGEAVGLLFPESAHVLDPRAVCAALAQAARSAGAEQLRTRVQALTPRARHIEVHTEGATLNAAAAVVCAGVWSERLLEPFGLRAPLEPVRGYHVELPQQPALVDAPLIYMNDNILVTPMAGRLRASSYMEFESAAAPPDARKPRQLRRQLRQLGYACDSDGDSWVGARPVLPDYLPGIGRAVGAPLYYAVGHQHLGLTLAPVSAQLVSELLLGREPRHDLAPFDLRRFH